MSAGAAAGATAPPAPTASPVVAPADLRLALGAAPAWVAVALCLARPAGDVLVLGIGAAVAGVALLILHRAPQVALMCFTVALVLLPLAGRLAHATASAALAAARQHHAVTATLTVTADPRPLVAKGPGGGARVAVAASLDALTRGGGRLADADGDVLVLGPTAGWQAVLPGQRVSVDGTLQPSLDGTPLVVVLFSRVPPRVIASPPWWQRLAGVVRSALRSAASILPAEERGLLPGLVVGDTSGMDPVLTEYFRAAGLTHLTAVSGTNCSLAIGAVVLVLRRARARPWITALLGFLALAGFVIVARPSPSVLRAAVMAGIALVALGAGRPKAALPALATAVVLLVGWDPLLAVDPGFTLSVLATAALLLVGPPWAAALRRRGVPVGIAEACAVAAAAHLVTAPVVAALSGSVSVVAIAANVLAEPVVAVVTVLGFVAALVSPWCLALGMALVWLAGWPCRWLVGVAEFFGSLPGATVPWPGGAAGAAVLAVALGAVLALFTWRRTRTLVAAAAVAAVLVQLPGRSIASGWPVRGWVLVACDIGQGDALVLSVGAGAGVVIDTGPEPTAVDRCLDDLGIDHIPLLVLTHYHQDHVGGLTGVLRHRDLGRVIVSPLAEPPEGAELVARTLAAHARRAEPVRAGFSATVGAARLEVLSPSTLLHGTRSDPNNASVVLRVRLGGLRLLLSGDAEVEAQEALVRSGVDLRADVLKVWHHGSAYFDPDYLAAIRPRVAVVSVGRDNDYGHPSPLALHALARVGAAVARTDQDGDVAVLASADGPRLVVRGHQAGRPVARGPVRADGSRRAALSVPDGRIAACPRDPSPSTTCPSRCPRQSPSSVRRSCSSSAPSARSPPRRGPPTRRSSSRS